MTDTDFLNWLKDPTSRKVILVEAGVNSGGVETTRYMSTIGYNSLITDTPPSVHYQPIVTPGLSFTEQLSLTGQSGLSFGDIEITNPNGARDSWVYDIWVNRPIKVYFGSPKWARSDFKLIFNGVIADISPKSRDTLALKLRDKLQLLNMPISETLLGGTSTNSKAVIPQIFGECHNITPLLIDPANLEYQVHTTSVENIFEVRDNGVPINTTVVNSTAKFKLTANPAGTITASVQGDKGSAYSNTLAGIIKRIVTAFGNATTRFTDSDIDLVNFAAFDAAHQQPMGVFNKDRTNVIAVCQNLAASIGAQMVMSREGLLRLYQITLPATNPTTVIRPYHMVERSLTPTGRTEVTAGVVLGFCKNWTVQTGLTTTIPAEHKALYEIEWLTSAISDAQVKANYRIDSTPDQKDTLLLRRVDADAEALRQLNIFKIPRATYEFEGTPEMLMLQLGQQVTIYNDRFGMQNGVNGVVISLQPNWLNGHVKVGFVI